jgi:hypothetical protein
MCEWKWQFRGFRGHGASSNADDTEADTDSKADSKPDPSAFWLSPSP